MKKGLFIILLSLTFFLQFRVWTGDSSVQEVLRLKKMVSNQALEIQNLEKRNLALRTDIEALKSGPLAFEERARSELGMIKANETFCLVVTPDR